VEGFYIKKWVIILFVACSLLSLSLFLSHYTAVEGDISDGKQVGDFYIEPAYQIDLSEMTSLETKEGEFKDMSLHLFMVYLAFCISPCIYGAYQIIIDLKIVSLLRFRTLDSNNVLLHSKRNEIYRIISENPGICSDIILKEMASPKIKIRYHLQMLMRFNYIEKHKVHGFVGYFDAKDKKIGDPEKNINLELRSRTEKEILNILRTSPGISRKEVSKILNISGPSVSWHIKRLESIDVVEVRQKGRSVEYYLKSALSESPEEIENINEKI